MNESNLHAGHMGNPSGSPDAETHFRHGTIPDEAPAVALLQKLACH